MHLDPALSLVVQITIVILLVSLLLRGLRQPHVVGYLLAGLLMGPQMLGLIRDGESLSRLGAVGVVLLLFFVGMEVSPRQLVTSWKITLLGTLLQILITVGLVWLLGQVLAWPLSRVVLIGFVASLSSTAVILKLLKDWGQLHTDVGQSALGILLAQDVALIPMLVIIGLFRGTRPPSESLLLQMIGALLVAGVVVWLTASQRVRLPLGRLLRADHELQVFAALVICFGLALLTATLQLSTALGAFLGGMVVASARETDWFHRSLEPFRVVSVALFFVSIGMLIDLRFLRSYWWQILPLVAIVLVSNTFINAGILRALGLGWRESLYTGSLLAQIGEFSFVLVAVGAQGDIISDFGYQLAIAVISVSLALSPAWIFLFRHLVGAKLTDHSPRKPGGSVTAR